MNELSLAPSLSPRTEPKARQSGFTGSFGRIRSMSAAMQLHRQMAAGLTRSIKRPAVKAETFI